MHSAEFRHLCNNYLDQPREVSIETLAKCNAACTFCPYPTLERIGDRMPDALINRLIDEMADFKQKFWFSPFKVNEPFLDKRLEAICNRFLDHCQQGTLRLFTNGSALTKNNIYWVARLPRLQHLWISLNEHRPDEYEKLMSLPFERTAKNLDVLHSIKEAGDFQHEVCVSRVGQDYDFQRYVHARWPLFTCQVIKRDSWLGFTEPDDSRVPPGPCVRWFELNITASGKTALCCMDGYAEWSIGDVSDRSLLSVYNDPIWRERREGLWSRKKVMPCSRCSY